MRIIDLLVKIANGEEVPERIKYDTKVMTYDHNKQDYLGYYSNGNGEWLFQYLFDRCKNTEHFINDKVEIIEEEQENEFTGLKMFSDGKCFCSIDTSEKIKCKDDVKIEDKKIPKKLEDYDFDDNFDSNTKCECLRERMFEIEDKINEIIDYLEENK